MEKYRNYEALLIHQKGNRTQFSCDFFGEAKRHFDNSKTAIKMILYTAIRNNTELKVYTIFYK